MRPTRREKLISQMRSALGDLQNPRLFEHDETVVFTIADTEFEFSEDNLEELQ